jgi:hypothetical protein
VSFLNIVLPLVSTFVGAGITYALNVRARRRNYKEDMFNQAIAAVMAADASVDYTTGVGRPMHLGDDEYLDVLKWMNTEAIKNWVTKVTQANEALARVVAYEPELERLLPFKPDAGNRTQKDEVIRLLRERAR